MDSLRNEYRLALRARQGDREALAALVEATRNRLFMVAYAELRHYDDAQDAVAAALLRICRHITEIQEPARVTAWMYRIVRNEARRIRHRGGAETVGIAEEVPVPYDVPLSLLRLDIERALARIPGDQARSLRLFHLAGQSIHEIAVHLGRSEGTIKSWLHRARHRLAAELEEYRPMESLPNAVIVHTDLEPDRVSYLENALRAAGYHAALPTAEEMACLLAGLKEGRFTPLKELLSKNELVVLDEQIGERSVFEILISIGALLEEAGQPHTCRLCLLMAAPWGSTAFAAWNQRVHLLVNKNNPEERERLAQSFRKLRQAGRGYSMKAKWACNTSLAVAARTGAAEIDPSHLALALLTDKDQASYRALQALQVDAQAIRREIVEQMGKPALPQAPLRDFLEVAQTTPVSTDYKVVRLFANQEAWRSGIRFLSTAHLLLGILRADDRIAGPALLRHGVDVNALRSASEPFHASEDSESDTYYAAEKEKYLSLWTECWERTGDYISS